MRLINFNFYTAESRIIILNETQNLIRKIYGFGLTSNSRLFFFVLHYSFIYVQGDSNIPGKKGGEGQSRGKRKIYYSRSPHF